MSGFLGVVEGFFGIEDGSKEAAEAANHFNKAKGELTKNVDLYQERYQQFTDAFGDPIENLATFYNTGNLDTTARKYVSRRIATMNQEYTKMKEHMETQYLRRHGNNAVSDGLSENLNLQTAFRMAEGRAGAHVEGEAMQEKRLQGQLQYRDRIDSTLSGHRSALGQLHFNRSTQLQQRSNQLKQNSQQFRIGVANTAKDLAIAAAGGAVAGGIAAKSGGRTAGAIQGAGQGIQRQIFGAPAQQNNSSGGGEWTPENILQLIKASRGG